eukprot:g446.t1
MEGKPLDRWKVPAFPVLDADGSSESDISSNLKLALDNLAPLEDKKERSHRETVLGNIQFLIKKWVKETALANGIPESEAKEAGGQILVSGSYLLGVCRSGSDIDAICVVPEVVKREDFFGPLYETLKAHPEVTELVPISGAAVPIMGFEFGGVPIDLLFARLPVNKVPADLNILDDAILTGVDEATEKSLNGPRVTNMLTQIVPNYETFKTVLRAVRTWAKYRGIYANKMGYLGGVNFAIMVAFACQLYPNVAPPTLLEKFFLLISEWQWPTPLMLNKSYENPSLNRPQWSADNYQDKNHKMPIITPAYPVMNSALAVSDSSLDIMMGEFKRAQEMVSKILKKAKKIYKAKAKQAKREAKRKKGKKVKALSKEKEAEEKALVETTIDQLWEPLFAPSEFFSMYSKFLVIDITATNEEDYNAWSGYVESRLRKLVEALEYANFNAIHLHPKGFKHAYKEANDEDSESEDEEEEEEEKEKEEGDDGNKGDEESKTEEEENADADKYHLCYFIGLEVPPQLFGREIDLVNSKDYWERVVRTKYRDYKPTMSLSIHALDWRQLPDWVFQDESEKRRNLFFIKERLLRQKQKREEEAKALAAKAAEGGPLGENMETPSTTEDGMKTDGTDGEGLAQSSEVSGMEESKVSSHDGTRGSDLLNLKPQHVSEALSLLKARIYGRLPVATLKSKRGLVNSIDFRNEPPKRLKIKHL